jgi:HEAT repeat protein
LSSANPQSERTGDEVTIVELGRSVNKRIIRSTDGDQRPQVVVEQQSAISEPGNQEQERTPQVGFEEDYLDAIRDLRSSDSAVERAAAARTLGRFGSLLPTAYLIAALFDQAPEVRRAAAGALNQIRDPDVALNWVNALIGADSNQLLTNEIEFAAPGVNHEQRLQVEPKTVERIEAEHLGPENSPIDTNDQTSRDPEQALVPFNSVLRDLPPLIVADLQSEDPSRRASALFAVARSGLPEGFAVLAKCFDDASADVRNAAALALTELDPPRTAEFFSQALEKASPERCRKIGDAIIASGLAEKAIRDLSSEDCDHTYNALCLLSVMVKSGAVEPLVQAIEEHQNVKVRSAAIRLLSASGQVALAEAAVKRRLGI